MSQTRPRAVLDTTVWVNALRSRIPTSASRLILEAILRGHIEIVASAETIQEHLEVFMRPKIGLDANEVTILGFFLAKNAMIVEISNSPQGCRDLNDDMFLETARLGKAEYLVTVDRDLLAADLVAQLKKEGISVVSTSEFLDVLRKRAIVLDNEIADTL